MGRIADARGEEALNIAAELVGILSEIAGDREFTRALADGMTAADAASLLLREHGNAVLRIFALDDGMDREEEERSLSPAAIPGRLLGRFKDPALKMLFGSAAAENGGNGSSAA